MKSIPLRYRDSAPIGGHFMLFALVLMASAFSVYAVSRLGSDLRRPEFGLGVGLVACFLLIIAICVRAVKRRRLAIERSVIMAFLERDLALALMTDASGKIIFQNLSALEHLGVQSDVMMSQGIAQVIVNPSVVVERLRVQCAKDGFAHETCIWAKGQVQISVRRHGPDHVWRIELQEEAQMGKATGRSLPMLVASKSGTILYMNEPVIAALADRVHRLSDMFEHLPLENGAINRIRTPQGQYPVRTCLVEGEAGRTMVYLFPVDETRPAQDRDYASDFDALPVALMYLRPTGEIVKANRLALKLLPQVGQDGVSLPTFLEGLGRSVGDWIKDASRGHGLQRSEVMRVTGSVPDQFLQVTLGRVIHDGEPTLLAVLTDATELKTMEAQFVQSQKMQAIGQLAGGVAHDFNNLLTAISGHCDLLLLKHDEHDEDYGDLTQIGQNANRAAALVGQLLAFSRKQTLLLEDLDLRDALADLTHLLNRLVGERVKLIFEHDPAVVPVRADRRQMEQVMMNLVVNARDAMPDGGEIKIETRAEYLEQPLSRDRVTIPTGPYVVVRVKDEGTGIPADQLTRIFEPFVTFKRLGEGTGLGLSMVYGIVKQTGGYIFVDSEVGTGTVFSLYFPALSDASVKAPAAPRARDDQALTLDRIPAPPRAEPAPRPTDATSTFSPDDQVVLLVEDEAPVRAFASRALQMRGLKVVEAACAEDALDLLDDPDLSIDVFVTDVMMPGMDGPTWVKKALKTRPKVKTVFMSGYAQENFEKDRSEVPDSVFLPKPFSLAELTKTVQDQLH